MRVHAFIVAALVSLAVGSVADAAYTTYRYKGKTLFSSEPVTVEFTFDPLVQDDHPAPFYGLYRMAGGDTRFQVSIGSHLSTPVLEYSIGVYSKEYYLPGGDQYTFQNLLGGDRIPIQFPGYIESAKATLYFRDKTPSIETDALFTSPPNPIDFAYSAISIEYSDVVLQQIYAILDPIPEPSSLAISLIAVCTVGAAARIRKGVRTPDNFSPPVIRGRIPRLPLKLRALRG